MKLVIVCGGRDYNDQQKVHDILDDLRAEIRDFMVIHGGAKGADTLAGNWAKARGLPEVIVPANWDFYSKRAGSIRNGWMINLVPDIVVAFPGGNGTANMVKQAMAVTHKAPDIRIVSTSA